MAELDAFLEAADAHLAASDADGSSMGAMLDAVPGDDRARAVAKARLQGTFASDLDRVAWRAGWHSGRLAAEPAVYRRMARGNGSIADAIAGLLPDVRLGVRATGIAERGGRVEVETGDDRIEADAAVVAVPVRLVTELAFDPPLQPEQREAFEGLRMGVASKLAVPLGGEPERCAIQCADLPFWFWVADGADGRPRRVVTSFAGSELPQEPLATASGDPAAWVRRIVRPRPRAPAGRDRGHEGVGRRPARSRRVHGLGSPVARAAAAVRTHARGGRVRGRAHGRRPLGNDGGRAAERPASRGAGPRAPRPRLSARTREREAPCRRLCIIRRTPGPADDGRARIESGDPRMTMRSAR